MKLELLKAESDRLRAERDQKEVIRLAPMPPDKYMPSSKFPNSVSQHAFDGLYKNPKKSSKPIIWSKYSENLQSQAELLPSSSTGHQEADLKCLVHDISLHVPLKITPLASGVHEISKYVHKKFGSAAMPDCSTSTTINLKTDRKISVIMCPVKK